MLNLILVEDLYLCAFNIKAAVIKYLFQQKLVILVNIFMPLLGGKKDFFL